MSELSLVKIRIQEGVWEGILSSDAQEPVRPAIVVTHLEQPLDDIQIEDQPDSSNEWMLRVKIPIKLLSDGVHTFLISEKTTGEVLGDFSIVAGEPLSQDIRAEMDLLREELDMLKRAFRRHCVETLR